MLTSSSHSSKAQTRLLRKDSLEIIARMQPDISYLEQLMTLMESITEHFYDLSQHGQTQWTTKPFQTLDLLVKACETLDIITKKMNLSLWQEDLTALLFSLHYLAEFKKTPTLSGLEDIQKQITEIDHKLKQFYILKYKYGTPSHLTTSNHLIFILENDRLYADTISLQLQDLGFDVQCFRTMEDLKNVSAHIHPDLILMDLNLHEEKLSRLDYLREIDSDIPVFVTSTRQDMETRLETARAGAKEYIMKPLDIDALHSLVCKHLKIDYQKPLKVLIIDDDDLTATTYAHFLKPCHVDIQTLTDPSKTLEEVEAHRPDLVLMDVRMPYANGYEVAQVIHQKYKPDDRPHIIYMTGSPTEDWKNYDLQKEDTLLKPLQPGQIIDIVDNMRAKECLDGSS